MVGLVAALVQKGNAFLPLDAPQDIDLNALLGGPSFFKDNWLKTPALFEERTPSTLDWPDVTATLAVTAGSQQEVTLCTAEERRSLRVGEYSSKSDVLDHISEQLVVIRDAHRGHPWIQQWQQAFSQSFGCPVTTGLYLNGPGAPGFTEHHDAHHVFALQLVGQKTWWVGEPVLVHSSRRYHWKEKKNTAHRPLVREAAQWLYLPPGTRHRAECSGELSVHVTFGVHAPRRLDAMEALIIRAGQTVPALRSPLPMEVHEDGVRWLLPEDLLASFEQVYATRHRTPLIVTGGTPVEADGGQERLKREETIIGRWPIQGGRFQPWTPDVDTEAIEHAKEVASELISTLEPLEGIYARGSVLEDPDVSTLFDLDLVLIFSSQPDAQSLESLKEILTTRNDPRWPFDAQPVLASALRDETASPYLRLCLAVRSLHLAGQPAWENPPEMRANRELAQQLAVESITLWRQAVQHLYQQPAASPQQRFPSEAVAWLQKRALRLTAFETLAFGAPFTRHPVGCVTLCQRYIPDLAPLAKRVCDVLLARDASNKAVSDAVGLGTEWLQRMSS